MASTVVVTQVCTCRLTACQLNLFFALHCICSSPGWCDFVKRRIVQDPECFIKHYTCNLLHCIGAPGLFTPKQLLYSPWLWHAAYLSFISHMHKMSSKKVESKPRSNRDADFVKNTSGTTTQPLYTDFVACTHLPWNLKSDRSQPYQAQTLLLSRRVDETFGCTAWLPDEGLRRANRSTSTSPSRGAVPNSVPHDITRHERWLTFLNKFVCACAWFFSFWGGGGGGGAHVCNKKDWGD